MTFLNFKLCHYLCRFCVVKCFKLLFLHCKHNIHKNYFLLLFYILIVLIPKMFYRFVTQNEAELDLIIEF